ncbi:neuronal-specific septin-3 isoform X2 [Ochotona curzoniae]|uniref:neuronal-specific septin-3 isoform X2 n=1 Tax=Ochotona curzoniae TaxID=130825 RepID=UPI001B3487CC|nr:neuronal-specific septin-3 isoform X2 [Ochotona curzoniae]
MDRSFAPTPPETQPQGAAFSHSHVLGHPARSSRLSGGVSPLLPVHRKTIHLDAFPKSHIPQTSGRPGPAVRAWSMPLQETCSVPTTSTLTANSVAPRKLSSISLKISQSSHSSPLLSHCEELPTLGKEAATQAGGRLLALADSPPVNLPSGGAVHSEGPGNPELVKPSRMPTVPSRMPAVRKPLVCSCLALPFQSQLTQSSPGFVGLGREGPGHTRTSPGRGKSRSRGLPRPQRGAQRANAVMSLSSQDTTKADVSRQLAAMGRTRPTLSISLAAQNTSRRDTGTEFPALDTTLGKAMNLASAGKAKSGIGLNLITVQTTKPSKIVDLRMAAPDKLGRGMATAATAKPDLATRDISVDLDTPDLNKLAPSTAMGDIARLGTPMALARANTAKVDLARESPTWNTSKHSPAMSSVVPGSPEPACGDTTLDDADHLSPWDMATCPPTARSSMTPEHGTVAFATQELARAYKGLPETRTDAAMSELVPEPRPKPAVPMKPVSINSNLLGYIGIDSIIEQMRKKTMKTGFDFNIMVVVIEEGGVKMKLTVIDTPGFGDQINNENCWEPIEKYINEQYEKFLKEEVNIARKKRIPDTRVHCCLYFISPTGHSLRPLDLEFMKHLSKVVNIVPVIAKADTMTLDEKSEFKQRVRKELEVHGIEFYPQKEFDEDLEDKTENDKIRQESMPFAVVGSDKEYQVNGKRVLGRKTPWGIIEVENLHHCEFALLRDFVIRTHLQDLKEVTHNIHYETYRAKRLNDNGGLPPGEGLLGTVLPPVPATPCPTAE